MADKKTIKNYNELQSFILNYKGSMDNMNADLIHMIMFSEIDLVAYFKYLHTTQGDIRELVKAESLARTARGEGVPI